MSSCVIMQKKSGPIFAYGPFSDEDKALDFIKQEAFDMDEVYQIQIGELISPE